MLIYRQHNHSVERRLQQVCTKHMWTLCSNLQLHSGTWRKLLRETGPASRWEGFCSVTKASLNQVFFSSNYEIRNAQKRLDFCAQHSHRNSLIWQLHQHHGQRYTSSHDISVVLSFSGWYKPAARCQTFREEDRTRQTLNSDSWQCLIIAPWL